MAVLCGLLIAPLLLLLILQLGRARADFDFVGRELRDVATLRAAWVHIQSQPASGGGDLALAASPVLILDPHSETYHLAAVLTSSLLQLGSDYPSARVDAAEAARQAVRDLTAAADSLPNGAVRRALESRVARLKVLAAAPDQITVAESRQMWNDTAFDLEQLLRLRQTRMIHQALWGLLLVGGFVVLACGLALTLALGVPHRVERIVDQIDRLTENDTARATPYLDDPNEMGRIAKGVEALRLSLIDAREAWGHVLLNEMRHALLAEHTRAIVLLTDAEGLVLSASPASASLEFDPDAVEGMAVWDLFEADDARALRDGAPGAAGLSLSRRGCRLVHDFGAIAQWDVVVTPSDEQDDGLVFLLSPSIDCD